MKAELHLAASVSVAVSDWDTTVKDMWQFMIFESQVWYTTGHTYWQSLSPLLTNVLETPTDVRKMCKLAQIQSI